MIYKLGTKHKIGDELFDDMIVNSEEEEEKLKLEGWESKSAIESEENKQIEAEKARLHEFPKMLYKLGGKLKIAGEFYSTYVVNSEEDQEVALTSGWSLKAELKPAEPSPVKKATKKAKKAVKLDEADYDPQF